MSRLCYLRHSLDINKKPMLINNIGFFILSMTYAFEQRNDAFNINLDYTKSGLSAAWEDDQRDGTYQRSRIIR
jgi:hypothetical protein